MILKFFTVRDRLERKRREIILNVRAWLRNLYIANRKGNGIIIRVKNKKNCEGGVLN
jgi:hypothetical protein